jgi:hypothetical protein
MTETNRPSPIPDTTPTDEKARQDAAAQERIAQEQKAARESTDSR